MTFDELKDYFNSIDLPDEPVRITSGEVITDFKLFVESHIMTIQNTRLSRYVRARYYNRLLRAYNILNQNL